MRLVSEVSKLEAIKQMLAANPDITWEEETIQASYPRSGSGYYRSVGFRIAPKQPILTAPGLRKFSAELVRQLLPVGPTSVSWCTIFAGKRDAVRMAALYFSEIAEDAAGGMETRIRVSVFPCRRMAQNIGYRGIIEIGGYECPEPCEFGSKCSFKVSKWKTLRRLL